MCIELLICCCRSKTSDKEILSGNMCRNTTSKSLTVYTTYTLTLSMPEHCIKLYSPGSSSNLFCSRGAHGTREAFDRL